MQNRLYNRYIKLKARGKTETKIIVAMARELSAFIWELQTQLNRSIPGQIPLLPLSRRSSPRKLSKSRPRSDELGDDPFSLARFLPTSLLGQSSSR